MLKNEKSLCHSHQHFVASEETVKGIPVAKTLIRQHYTELLIRQRVFDDNFFFISHQNHML